MARTCVYPEVEKIILVVTIVYPVFYLGFLVGGEAVRCASTEQSRGSGGILPQNFTLPEMQSSAKSQFKFFGAQINIIQGIQW